MKTAEPTLNQAYALIIDYECQKGIGLKTTPNSIIEGNDKTALWSARGSQTYRKPHNEHWNERCEFCKIKGHLRQIVISFLVILPIMKARRKRELLLIILS